MSYTTDPRVDAYIDALPEWQRRICHEVRSLVHSVDPEVTETVKRTKQPYFVLLGNICALLAARNHVNILCTTAPSSLTPKESSPPATTTRPLARSQSAKAKPSTRPPSPQCSIKSLRLVRTARALDLLLSARSPGCHRGRRAWYWSTRT